MGKGTGAYIVNTAVHILLCGEEESGMRRGCTFSPVHLMTDGGPGSVD